MSLHMSYVPHGTDFILKLFSSPDVVQVEAEMARGCQAAGDSVAAMDAFMKLAAKKDRLSKVCDSV